MMSGTVRDATMCVNHFTSVALEDTINDWILRARQRAADRIAAIGPINAQTSEDVEAGRVAAYQKGYQYGVDATLVDAIYVLQRAKTTRPAPSTETIVSAAMQYEGVTISLPLPARHGQVMHSAESFMSLDQIAASCQGFLTSTGRFVNRVQARQIAYVAGQTTGSERDLFSEDLW